MWANWLRTEPSWSNKLLYFKYKESLLTFSCSLGFTGAAISPLLANLMPKVDFPEFCLLDEFVQSSEKISLNCTFFLQLKRPGENMILHLPSLSHFSLRVKSHVFWWRLPQPSQKKINHLLFSSHIFLFLNSLFSASDLSTNLFFYSCAYSVLFLTYFVLQYAPTTRYKLVILTIKLNLLYKFNINKSIKLVNFKLFQCIAIIVVGQKWTGYSELWARPFEAEYAKNILLVSRYFYSVCVWRNFI